MNCFQPDGTLHPAGKLTCGYPGAVTDIRWSFVRRHGDKDVYAFTRRFPADVLTSAMTFTNEVEFGTNRVMVFQDKFQAIVIGPPKT